MTSPTFRSILQTEFVKRCKLNPAYSMRAYAKYLNVDQSLLSKIMRSQRSVSKKNLYKLGAKIGLSPSQIKSLETPGEVVADNTFQALTDDEFICVSDWYHFAMLELAKTAGFQSDPRFISRRLGIHIEEARAAIDRLSRLGLIKINQGKWYAGSKGFTFFNAKSTSDQRRRLQFEFLKRGMEALEAVPFDLRENGSLTVAVDSDRVPEFKERLRKVRQELGDFFQSHGKLTEVYQLTMSFYPLTKIERDGK